MKKLHFISMILFALIGLSGKFYGQSGVSCDSAKFLYLADDNTIPEQSQTIQNQWLVFGADTDTLDITLTGANFLVTDKVNKLKLMGGTCSALSELGSDTISSTSDSILTIHITGLTIGNYYYLKVFKNGNSNTIAYNILLSFKPKIHTPCSNTAPLIDCDLVFNGGFENFTPAGTVFFPNWDLPNEYWLGGNIIWACPWTYEKTSDPTYYWGNPDLFESDNLPTYTIDPLFQAIPKNWWGGNLSVASSPPGGQGYAGFYAGHFEPNGDHTNKYSEHFTQELRVPMSHNVTYNVSMQVECANFTKFATDHIGMFITSTNPYTINYNGYASAGGGSVLGDKGISLLASQINGSNFGMSSNPGPITSNKGWVTISGQYTAAGGEKYIIVGYFGSSFAHDDFDTNPSNPNNYDFIPNNGVELQSNFWNSTTDFPDNSPNIWPNNHRAYYYVDNISITQVVPPLTVTGPTTSCYNVYTINNIADFPGFSFNIALSDPNSSVGTINTTTGEFTVNWDAGAFSSGTETITVSGENAISCSIPPYVITVTGCCRNGNGTPVLGNTGGSLDIAGNTGLPIDRVTQLVPNSISCSNCLGAGWATMPGTTTFVNGQTFAIDGDFYVDGDANFNDCDIVLGKNAKIIVQSPYKLEMIKTHLHACEDMWDGIYTSNVNSFVFLEACWVEDAKNAVVSENGGQYSLECNIFNKNYKSVIVRNFGQPTSNGNYLIQGNLFTCCSLTAAMLGFPNSFSCPYIPSFNSIPSIQSVLINGKRSYVGVEVSNITDANPLTVGSLALATGGTNVFDYLDFGVRATNSNVDVKNNKFQNIFTIPPFFPKPEQSAAVWAQTNATMHSTAYYIQVGGSGNLEPNSFDNCQVGVKTWEYNTKVISNSFNNMLSDGVYIINNAGRTNKILNNEMTDVLNGILINNLSNNNSNSTIISGNAITPTITTANNNSSNNISNSGIVVLNPTSSQTVSLTISNNTIHEALRSILCLNVNGGDIKANTIDWLSWTGSMVNQYRYGVRLIGCSHVSVEANGITCSSTISNPILSAERLYGVFAEQSAYNNIFNNTMTRMGTGMAAYGNCNGTEMMCNIMDECYNGVGLLPYSYATATGIGASTCDQLPNGIDSYNQWSSTIPSLRRITGKSNGAINWNYAQGGDFSAFGIPASTNVNPHFVPIAHPCGHSPVTTSDERELKYGKIVRGEIVYDTLADLFSLHDSIVTFSDLSKYDTLMNYGTSDDTLYRKFYNYCKFRNIGQFEKVNTYILDTTFADTAAAYTTNNNIISTNTPEDNQKAVNAIYINQVAYEQDTTLEVLNEYEYSPGDSAILNDIAYQNPIHGGEAVVQARALLKLDIYDDMDFNDKKLPSSEKGYPSFAVFPNPNDGNMIVNYTAKEGDELYFIIYDIAGKLVKKQKLNANANEANISALELKSGTYFYSIKKDDKDLKNGKIVIVK